MSLLDRVPVRDARTESCELGEELLVLDGNAAVVRGLNPTAAKIWTLMDGIRTGRQIAGMLAEHFDAGPEQVEREVGEFLQQLAQRSLIRITTPQGGAGGSS